MPRRQIQRAFLSWLEQNHDRFAVKILLGKRTDRFWEFSFVGINSAIEGALATYEINVAAENMGECWDLLLSLDAAPRRAAGGGYFCACCLPEARRTFPDRPALWADHLFEPLLEWANESLIKAQWLALSGDPGYATQARLLAGDDPSETLPGGGCTLDFSFISGERKRPEPRGKEAANPRPVSFRMKAMEPSPDALTTSDIDVTRFHCLAIYGGHIQAMFSTEKLAVGLFVGREIFHTGIFH